MPANYSVRPILESLDRGQFIRESVALVLRVLAILGAIASLFLVIEMIKLSFQLPTEGTVGGLLLSILFAVSIVVIVQILFTRASHIAMLGDSSFTVIPVFSLLLRASGEMYATLTAAVGVGGCLFIWFAKLNPLQLLGGVGAFVPAYSTEGTFLGGLLFLVYLLLLSFAILVFFYFLAEATVVLADIAVNIRRLVSQANVAGLPRTEVPTVRV